MIIVLSPTIASDPIDVAASNMNHSNGNQTTITQKFSNQRNAKEAQHDDSLSRE